MKLIFRVVVLLLTCVLIRSIEFKLYNTRESKTRKIIAIENPDEFLYRRLTNGKKINFNCVSEEARDSWPNSESENTEFKVQLWESTWNSFSKGDHQLINVTANITATTPLKVNRDGIYSGSVKFPNSNDINTDYRHNRALDTGHILTLNCEFDATKIRRRMPRWPFFPESPSKVSEANTGSTTTEDDFFNNNDDWWVDKTPSYSTPYSFDTLDVPSIEPKASLDAEDATTTEDDFFNNNDDWWVDKTPSYSTPDSFDTLDVPSIEPKASLDVEAAITTEDNFFNNYDDWWVDKTSSYSTTDSFDTLDVPSIEPKASLDAEGATTTEEVFFNNQPDWWVDEPPSYSTTDSFDTSDVPKASLDAKAFGTTKESDRIDSKMSTESTDFEPTTSKSVVSGSEVVISGGPFISIPIENEYYRIPKPLDVTTVSTTSLRFRDGFETNSLDPGLPGEECLAYGHEECDKYNAICVENGQTPFFCVCQTNGFYFPPTCLDGYERIQFRCPCPMGQVYNTNNICIANGCENEGQEECGEGNAGCRYDPDDPTRYECGCLEGMFAGPNGKCVAFDDVKLSIVEKTQIVRLGQTAVIRCRDEGNWRLPVLWTRPSKFVISTLAQVLYDRLRIENSQASDDGIYICYVGMEYSARVPSKMARLIVKPDGKPATGDGDDIEVRVDQTPDYVDLANGCENGQEECGERNTGCRYDPDDPTRYECDCPEEMFAGPNGKCVAFDDVKLSIVEKYQTVRQGQTAVIRCRDEGNSRLPVQWTRPSKSVLSPLAQVLDDRLTIENSQGSDDGIYICYVGMGYSARVPSEVARLIVLPDGKPATGDGDDIKVRIGQTPDYFDLGSDVRVSCRDEGPHHLPVEWSRDHDRPLPLAASVRQGLLFIPKVRLRDSGWYTCKVIGKCTRQKSCCTKATFHLGVKP